MPTSPLVEIGGTVGDIESQPFLEAIRQLRVEIGAKRAMLMHLTLVPYIATAGETKTKPTQHLGQGAALHRPATGRAGLPFRPPDRRSLAAQDRALHQRRGARGDRPGRRRHHLPHPVGAACPGPDDIVVERFGLECGQADLSEWDRVVDAKLNPEREVTIAMVGKYMELLDAYKSLIEAMTHAGIQSRTKVNLRYIDSEDIEQQGTSLLEGVDAILVPGGFGLRGVEGKISTVQYARENKIPYLGICLGMQVAVIEYARNVLGWSDANSTEFDKSSGHPVVGLITEWQDATGATEIRTEASDLAAPCAWAPRSASCRPAPWCTTAMPRT